MDQAPLYQSKRCVIALMAIAAAYPLAQARDFGAVGASTAAGTSVAGPTYVVPGTQADITTRALARRDAKIQDAMSALERGREYYKNGKYPEALQEYKQALDVLPKAPVTDDRRAFIIQSIGDASVATAQEYRQVGRYDEARQLLEEAIKINPKNKLAERELTYLEDPVRSNPAKTPQYVKDVEEVNRLLNMGFGYYDLGQFDAAHGEFNKVLRLDPYNTAARRGMEAVDRRRASYYAAAYDQARANALIEVSKAWEVAVPTDMPDIGTENTGDSVVARGQAANNYKLKNLRIPRVDFEDTPVEDAIDFLRQRSRDLDTTQGDGSRGINFVINDNAPGGGMANPNATTGLGDISLGDEEEGVAAPAAAPDIKQRRIKELKLNDVPMEVVLQFICQSAGLRYKVEDHAVVILPAGSTDDQDLYTRTFTVPADFISALASAVGDSESGPAVDDPFNPNAGSSTGIRQRKPPQEYFKRMGISFGEGCSATYIASNSTLLVRNTTANLDMIEQTIENLKARNKQIKISTKFVEISQENTDELSFDWVVTPFSVNDGRSLFMGGGTSEGTGMSSNDFVGNPGGVNGWPVSSAAEGVPGLSTGAIRSGSGAISKDSLDSLMLAQNRSEASQNYRAPGILSMTGIYDEGAFQAIMRGLSQKKGSDVLTAPAILARPSETAKIEVIREFIYPEEYEPPQLPTNVGSNNNDGYRYGGSTLGELTGGSQAQVNSFPVTPATPTSFTSRSVGVTLEVMADVGDNDYVINLEFKPEIVEFEGFVNYGSPIQSTGVGSDGKPVSITLTDNRIEQPIFATRRVETKVYIYDGYTVGIGGLITESVQTVEDKVPIFGDLPFVGRFFRGNSESHTKKNLMIFVTGQIVDATGLPIRGRNLSMGLPQEDASGLPSMDAGLLPPQP